MCVCTRCGVNILSTSAGACIQCGHVDSTAAETRPDTPARLYTRDAVVVHLHRQGCTQAGIALVLARSRYGPISQGYVSKILRRNGVSIRRTRDARNALILQMAERGWTQAQMASWLTARGTPMTQSGVSLVLRSAGICRQWATAERDDYIARLCASGLMHRAVADAVADAGYQRISAAAVSHVMLVRGVRRKKYGPRRPKGSAQPTRWAQRGSRGAPWARAGGVKALLHVQSPHRPSQSLPAHGISG